jgi:hypothetical protein
VSDDVRIARLGDGKWHIVRAFSDEGDGCEEWAACGIVLRPVRSSVMSSEVEVRQGQPTCEHCVRWKKHYDKLFASMGETKK